jgi:hypothetical protein
MSSGEAKGPVLYGIVYNLSDRPIEEKQKQIKTD